MAEITNYVILHSEWGVFVGECMGLLFFSANETCNQPGPPCWDTEETCQQGLDDMMAIIEGVLDDEAREHHHRELYSVRGIRGHVQGKVSAVEVIAAGLPWVF